MNQINILQNDNNQIELLSAQRFFYSRAKKFLALRLFGSLIVAIVGPILASMDKDISSYAGFGSILFLILGLYFEYRESYNKSLAAKIQELFDTRVLNINWNDLSTGDQPDLEDIKWANNKVDENTFEQLRNWYSPKVEVLNINIGRLICQRSNMWWDYDLRKKYIQGLSWISGGVIVVLIIIGINLNLVLGEFILGILLPILPLFEVVSRQIVDHHKTSRYLQKLKNRLNYLLDNPLKIKEPEQFSRLAQDQIFHHRENAPLIFDWIYRIFRSSQQSQMEFSAERKIDEIVAKYGDAVD